MIYITEYSHPYDTSEIIDVRSCKETAIKIAQTYFENCRSADIWGWCFRMGRWW